MHAQSAGEGMAIGEIDQRLVSPTNELPKLTPEQAAAHTWIPAAGVWEAIKKHSVADAAVVTISGFSEQDARHAVSRGRVTIHTSKDPVGAPIFYRDVPLMPSETERGIIKPLAPSAIRLIQWRLRNIGDLESRVVLKDMVTCANCHSFSGEGKTMVKLAERAVQLSGARNPVYLDTLAAAYAEVGRFPEAIAAARKALDLAAQQHRGRLVEALNTRIKLYESQQPYRDAMEGAP
jgi:tetratricopeptide (TPR) repeat protein